MPSKIINTYQRLPTPQIHKPQPPQKEEDSLDTIGELDVEVRIPMPVRSMRPGYPYSKAFGSEMLVDGFEPWPALDQGDTGSEPNGCTTQTVSENFLLDGMYIGSVEFWGGFFGF